MEELTKQLHPRHLADRLEELKDDPDKVQEVADELRKFADRQDQPDVPQPDQMATPQQDPTQPAEG